MKPEKQLYQWDTNQSFVELTPSAQFVDYPIGDEVIRIKSDGTRCRIPDEVLQTYGGKTCYERYPDGTFRAYSFTVLYSPKPPDYVFTPEEHTTFESLTARVDSAIDEINRRADSGEFTPKKGVDYFTEAEKNEMVQSVSSGAVGEFREVVNSETADFNRNSSAKTNDYNTNATDKLSTYNSNAEKKLKAYNDNHTEKVAEYNANAETKTAEFDSNAAALQEQIAEKANVDGYYEEMTVGDAEQLISSTYAENSEPYGYRTTGGSADVGNRAYLDKIIGGTVVWNQLAAELNATNWGGSYAARTYANGVATIVPSALYGRITRNGVQAGVKVILPNHKYLVIADIKAVSSTTLSLYIGDDTAFTYKKLLSATTSWANYSWVCNIASSTAANIVTYGVRSENASDLAEYQLKNFMLFDLTQMFGSTIADYIYSLEQSQAGAGVAWFKKLFPKDYYEYNAGELLSVGGLKSHDTVGFNQWDEEWEVGDISTSTGEDVTATNRIRSKGFMPCLPNVQYCFTASDGSLETALLPFFYDADKRFVSFGSWSNVQNVQTTPHNCHYMRFKESTTYGTTYKNDICINLSDPSRNGEYEPYEKHSYPLDSSLTLRGIPKLDASNNLYYDGDEYASDGTVKRKYGVYTIQASNVSLSNNAYTNISYAEIVSLPNMLKSIDKQCVHSKFGVGEHDYPFDDAGLVGKLLINSSVDRFWFGFAKGTTEEQMKSALDGTTIVYELATPTAETAKPFQHIQIVDDFGTEEFVSTGIVPVGHKTRYPANLRDKLQHLPDLASADGTYLVKQTGKQMSLIHMPAVFPEIPTEDGTYTLETVVTGGVATLQWVAK